jgi:A/G-specific adenine glycosylase
MLQQTQVATVLDYYARFLERFPDVQSLAQASQEDVLGLWSGLGYYSRARNLHRCAQSVVTAHAGLFPSNVEALAELPGIGRSTAGAIAAFCFSQRAPILDANVRRVLTRVVGFDEDLAIAKNERALWAHAEALLPTDNLTESMPRYTQGMMDLGAAICTPKNPQCLICPVADLCVAKQEGQPERYPVKTRKLSRRSESWWLLVAQRADGAVWLETRPQTGIWAGLQCVPVFLDRAALTGALVEFGAESVLREEPVVMHVLTHRDLYLHPLVLQAPMECEPRRKGQWLKPVQWATAGLPAPIRKLLNATG